VPTRFLITPADLALPQVYLQELLGNMKFLASAEHAGAAFVAASATVGFRNNGVV
jgi:hypothetical protein